jgi:mRNA interferase MazF
MKHGEIWLVNFSPSVGEEIKSLRPVLVISSDSIGALSLKIVVPLTDARKTVQPWHS